MEASTVDHLIKIDLYDNCQHGFSAKISCVPQILKVTADLTKAIDMNAPMHAMYENA